MAIPEKKKLEALAYLIAGLSTIDAARRANVSCSSLNRWDHDKTLRAKARSVYIKAIKNAREHISAEAKALSDRMQKTPEEKQKAKIASIMSKLSPAQRTAMAKRGAAAAKAKRKVVVINQHPVTLVPIALKDDETLEEKLKRLSERFNKR